MSIDEDVDNIEIELKDLVTQTLEENGILSKIRAQLRAGLYLTLEDEIKLSESHPNSLKSKLNDPKVCLIFNLVREFLEYFHLEFTTEVFDKETYIGDNYEYVGREKLIENLELGMDNLIKSPLLLEILNIAHGNHDNRPNITALNKTNESNNKTFDVKQNDTADETTEHGTDVRKTFKEYFFQKFNHSSSSDESQEIDVNESVEPVKSTARNSQIIEPDDTYEGTSSIAEDSVLASKEQSLLIDFDKTIRSTQNHKNIIDQSIDEPSKPTKLASSPENSSSSDKKHPKDKLEKLKPMSGLSSLSDLPPLPIKSRNSDTVLLPSLYSKEFREKSNLKEIDKMLGINFDSLDNYEEDIMSTGIDLENNVVKNGKTDQEIVDQSNLKNSLAVGENTARDSATSISEDLDFNSNVDDNS